MSNSSPERGNNNQKNYSENDYDEEDDLITYQFDSSTINFHYSHFAKYSRLIRNKYLYPDVKNRLPQELRNFQEQYDINSSNIVFFFQLLQEDFIINQQLDYKQYTDLYKLSEILQVKKLSTNLIQYFNDHKVDSDFQIQIILHDIKSNTDTENSQFQLNSQIEDFLSSKIADCFNSENFAKLPISVIFRIVEKSDKQQLQSDSLYDFIKKDVNSLYPLFLFLKVENLSDEKFNEMFNFFNDPKGAFKPFLNCLPCSLSYIMKLRDEKKSLEKQVEKVKSEKNKISKDFGEMESEKNRLMNELQKVTNEKETVEKEMSKIQTQLNESENEKKRVERELGLIQTELKEK